MMTILITGSKGQLGTELCKLLDDINVNYEAVDIDQLDITNEQQVLKFFKEKNPNIVFHCAAFTAVDKAEEESRVLNWKVNVDGTTYIAKASESVGATLYFISTDYVFDGRLANAKYKETDQTNPQNEYGKAKLAGEIAVQEVCSKYYIVRTSWVFGEFGNNFVYTMQRLAKSQPLLKVVDDQVGRPTWTKSLAEFLLFLNERQPEYGIYHFSNEMSCTWYEFAKEILKNEEIEILPVCTQEFPQKAKRPQYSVMDLEKSEALGFEIPTWKEALEVFLDDTDKKTIT